jgi:hypothetical protein
MDRTRTVSITSALVLLSAVTFDVHGQSVPRCDLGLAVIVTPDVPDPSTSGFLSSLLGNHTSYRLTLRNVVDDTHVELELTGPGPAQRCLDVVDSMREDGRIESIDVEPAQ